MRLRSIALEGFRCFGPKTVIGPLDERLNVIHGPNGAGKSTLLLAVERTLFDRPDSTDTDIQALVPWGADVLPRVEIEFSMPEGTFRLSKAFGRRGEARLWKLEGDVASPVREGATAVEWAREILGGQAPSRGATKPEHRGLAQVLFVAQGGLDLPERLGPGASERLRAIVGGTAVDPVTRAMAAEIDRQYLASFTPGGKPKKGSPAESLAEQADRARQERDTAKADWERIDGLQDAVARTADAVAASERKRDELHAEKQRLAPRVRRYRELVQQRDEAQRAKEAAEAAFREIAERIDRIGQLRRREDELRAALRSAESKTAQASQTHLQARGAADEATRRRQEHEERERAVREAEELAAHAREFHDAAAAIAELEPRLERIAKLRGEIGRLEEQAAKIPDLSGRHIKKLRDALAEERSAGEALEALKLHVTVRALRKTSVEVDGKTIDLEAGATEKLDSEGSLTLQVGTLAELAIAGPVTDVTGARDRLTKARAAVRALASELGSDVPEELEERRARRAEIVKALEVHQARLADWLGDAETEEELQKRLSSARARRDGILRLHPNWKAAPPDPEEQARAASASREDFDRTARHLRREEEAARSAVDRAAQALEQARAAEAKVRSDLEGVVGELRATAGDGCTDEERARKRMEQSVALQRAEDALRQASAALEEFPEDPTAEYERVDRALQDLQDELPATTAELGRRQQALEEALAAAPYARLAACEERLAEIERALDRARLDADAIALLHALFVEERDRATALLFQPVAERVVPRLRRLVGPTVSEVEFDEQFRPAGLRLRGVQDRVSPDDLSFGTRDQLSLLVRIALGEIVAREGRLPIVLDDPLAHADASRLRRFLGILEDASKHLQVIVLTCRPDDYRGLAAGRFLPLEHPGEPPAAAPGSP
ncbi:MAG: AAA family ATPase [Myxococcales bacterium]|nr:AAA family ATPase [Myxococcales bacterium]